MSYPNQFYLPPNPALPNPQLVPQPFPTGIPPQPPQPQPQFNLAALQQQQQQAQGPQRNGTPQQMYAGIPGGMVHPTFMGAPQTLTPQPQPPQGLPGQPQQNQVNMTAVEQLLRSGQLTPDQFNALAQQIRTQQQQQAQRQAAAVSAAQAQAPGLPPFLAAPPLQQQQLPPQPLPPAIPQPAPASVTDRIPFQLLQGYFAQLSQLRGMQQKTVILQNAVQTGLVPAPGTNGGQTQVTPQQRPLLEKQLEDAKRATGAAVQALQAFQNQWTQQRISADWQWYQSQRQGQPQPNQQQPRIPQPPAPAAAPPLPQPQSLQPNNLTNMFSSPQLTAAALNNNQQLLQRQAQAQAAVNAAGRSTPSQQQQQLPKQIPPPGQPQQQQQQFVGQPQQQQATGQPQLSGQMPPLHLLQTQLNPQLFMKSLFEVMRTRGEPIETTPFVDGKEVDLYQLYQTVMVAGGSQAVHHQGAWHRVAAQLGWPVDASANALRDAPPETQRISLELARTYSKLLRPFEEIWAKSLVKQQQQIMEAQRKGQQQLASATHNVQQLPTPQQQQQLPPQQRPPSQNAVRPPSQNAVRPPSVQPTTSSLGATQLEASRNQLLQQAKAASLVAQQLQTSAPAFAAKQQRANTSSPLMPQQQVPKAGQEPAPEQMEQAKQFVGMLKAQIEAQRPKLKSIETAEDQRQSVTAMTNELVPHVRKVVETLPLFYAMTGDQVSTRKMLTFAAIFQDQIRYMASNQFALDVTGLTQLRDQFQRCWQFMRQHATSKAAGPNSSGAQQQQAPASSPPIKPEQFSTAAQKSGIRVEDLKPPPAKHRRTASANAGSPSGLSSPQTPQTNAASPPQAGATPAAAPKKRGRSKKDAAAAVAGSSPAAAPAGSPAATLAALRSDLIKDSPSPRGIVVPAPPPPVVEESPSLKRKREEEEIERDPDAYIEKTLKILGSAVPSFDSFHLPGISNGVAPGLALSVDPAIPLVVHDPSASPLSFAVLSSSNNMLPTSNPLRESSFIVNAEPFDFDLYIDSSAAGFDDDIDAPTPDLIGGAGAVSAATPATPADAIAATPQYVPASLAKSPKKQVSGSSPSSSSSGPPAPTDDAFYTANGVFDDDLWLKGGAPGVPNGFSSWEAPENALDGGSAWNFYSVF
ncbi:ARID/BRIGHT DNA-binding domain containing protein [Rhodotorula toruloides]|uniref:ARID/BRIGHT DNA-binding domain containing protein n=1 Tax=Rhodotorula toruloides TaxID=5286 RepID=A0A511KRJ5_RHOTO|nr:ARID/BRIGHT DNA-binding domain containing protein [Rhodotorula toruloides]